MSSANLNCPFRGAENARPENAGPENAGPSRNAASLYSYVASRKKRFASSSTFAATAGRNDVTRCKLQPINALQLTRCSQSASSRPTSGL